MIRIPKELVVGLVKTSNPEHVPAADIVPNERERASKIKRITSQTKEIRKLVNQPLPGFTILNTASGWYGSKTFWTVLDPRGYKANISSGNIDSILSCGSISKGLIQDRCVWGYNSGEMVLIPESSSVFKDAQFNTNLLDSKVNLRELAIGSTVKLKSKVDAIYLGSYYTFMMKDIWRPRNIEFSSSTKKRLFFAKYDKTGSCIIFSENTNKISSSGPVDERYNDKKTNIELIISHIKSGSLKSDVRGQDSTGWNDKEVKSISDSKMSVSKLELSDNKLTDVTVEVYQSITGEFYFFDPSSRYSSSSPMTLSTTSNDIIVGQGWVRASDTIANCKVKYINVYTS